MALFLIATKLQNYYYIKVSLTEHVLKFQEDHLVLRKGQYMET